MTVDSSYNGKVEFQELNQRSGTILYHWIKRSGMNRGLFLNEIARNNPALEQFGEKSLKQWTSEGDSARRVSGNSPEVRGDRLVAIVKWFINEHLHRVQPVLTSSELRDLMSCYQDIPVKNRLQLRKLLHDLEINSGEREANFSFANDWKAHFANWPSFCFVLDEYWCLKATTSYELALNGYSEKDLNHWSCWHRLTASQSGLPKFSSGSQRYSLRGPYNQPYYSMQLNQFYGDTEKLRQARDNRYEVLMELLRSTENFNETWEISLKSVDNYQQPFGIPVPFFRKDETLLWMLELRTTIPNTKNFSLITWMPLNEDTAEYEGEIKRWVDQSGKFNKQAYFIEDFSSNFSDRQKLALGAITN
jgi:hypothetical protein